MTSFEIIEGDFLKQKADIVVVNYDHYSCHEEDPITGRVCKTAGLESVEAVNYFKEIKIGDTIVTKGFNLDAEWIIHVCAPRFGVNPENKDEA